MLVLGCVVSLLPAPSRSFGIIEVIIVDRARRGEPPARSLPPLPKISDVLVPFWPALATDPAKVETLKKVVDKATPKEIKEVIRGGERLANSAIEGMKAMAGVTVEQFAVQAQLIVGSAEATSRCLAEANKCGRHLDKAKELVDNYGARELEWMGRRMVAVGQFTQDLHEEMAAFKGEVLSAMEKVQAAAAQLNGFGSDLDPVAQGLTGLERILGNPKLKESYQKFAKDHQAEILKVGQSAIETASLAGDKVGMTFGQTVEGLGVAADYLGYYLAASSGGFPEALDGAAPVLRKGEVANIAVGVSAAGLNEMLDGLQSERFAIGKSLQAPGDNKEFVSVRDFTASLDPTTHSIMVYVRGGAVHTRVAGNTVAAMKVSSMRLQLVPSVSSTLQTDGTYQLALVLKPRVLQVDVKELPTRLDQAVAYALNDTALKKPLAVGLSAALAPVVSLQGSKQDGTKDLRRVAFVPGKVDFIMMDGMFNVRSVGKFQPVNALPKARAA